MFSRAYIGLSSVVAIAVWLGWVGVMTTRDKVFLTGSLMGGLAPVLWVDTLLKCGLRSLGAVPMMLRVFGRSSRGATLTGVVVICLLFWLSPFATNPSPYRIHMSVFLVLVVAFLWLQPPYCLMLGESSHWTGRALGHVSCSVYPLRVVALLDLHRTGYVVGSFSFLTDSLRTESDQDWRNVVDSVADWVRLIVLDARTDSPIVVSEVGMLLSRPDRLRRAFFIVGAHGESPALAAHKLSADSPGIRSLREEEIKTVLKKVTEAKQQHSGNA